jgi:DNA-binding transcriptional MocR family regulator
VGKPRTGVPDVTRFPFDIWQRLSARAARALARERIIREEPQGRQALREAMDSGACRSGRSGVAARREALAR